MRDVVISETLRPEVVKRRREVRRALVVPAIALGVLASAVT